MAVLDGMSQVTWPGDELFQKVVDALDRLHTCKKQRTTDSSTVRQMKHVGGDLAVYNRRNYVSKQHRDGRGRSVIQSDTKNGTYRWEASFEWL